MVDIYISVLWGIKAAMYSFCSRLTMGVKYRKELLPGILTYQGSPCLQ